MISFNIGTTSFSFAMQDPRAPLHEAIRAANKAEVRARIHGEAREYHLRYQPHLSDFLAPSLSQLVIGYIRPHQELWGLQNYDVSMILPAEGRIVGAPCNYYVSANAITIATIFSYFQKRVSESLALGSSELELEREGIRQLLLENGAPDLKPNEAINNTLNRRAAHFPPFQEIMAPLFAQSMYEILE